MAGKVFFSVSMSLDGFIAPESIEDLMGPLWRELQQWVFALRYFRENLGLGEGGEEGATTTSHGRRTSAPARASWASACSTAASWHGRTRRPSTPRCSSSPTRSVTRGSG